MNDPNSLDIDFDRARRCGFPEVVFAQGKTDSEVLAAANALHEAHGKVLVTRAGDSTLDVLHKALPDGTVHLRARCFFTGQPQADAGPVAVVSAGTSDEPVAAEAAVTLRMRGVTAERFRDCGVAGLQRLLKHEAELRSMDAIVVVAGMEGALASVLGGLVDCPVIACPTSVGYGISEGGRTALHSMLASCVAGLTVVNIDNGFGAGFAAATIARKIATARNAPARPAG